jgi:hypothetical protein
MLDFRVDGPAAGVPEHHARRLFLGMEQVELAAELAVIALLGLLEAMQVLLELPSCRGQAVP